VPSGCRILKILNLNGNFYDKARKVRNAVFAAMGKKGTKAVK
jgi:hypothetical protein